MCCSELRSHLLFHGFVFSFIFIILIKQFNLYVYLIYICCICLCSACHISISTITFCFVLHLPLHELYHAIFICIVSYLFIYILLIQRNTYFYIHTWNRMECTIHVLVVWLMQKLTSLRLKFIMWLILVTIEPLELCSSKF